MSDEKQGITIRLPKAMAAWVQAEAERRGCAKAQVIRDLIVAAMGRGKKSCKD